MQPHEQADQRVQQSIAEVRDGQSAARQQAAVRQRVVEVARDEEPVAAARAVGDDGDDGRRREPILGEAAQEAVLAQRKAVGQLLDHVGRAVAVGAELDQLDDMAVQTEHRMDVGQIPLVEVDGERQRPHVGVVGRIGRAAAASPSVCLHPCHVSRDFTSSHSASSCVE